MSHHADVSVVEIIGTRLCVASDDGQKIHDRIAAALQRERRVTVSFANVTDLTAAFLNAAIGQLFGGFPEERIRAGVQVAGIAPDDLALLKRVVANAKIYFRDRRASEATVREALGDERVSG